MVLLKNKNTYNKEVAPADNADVTLQGKSGGAV